jgi:hypothetical protein
MRTLWVIAVMCTLLTAARAPAAVITSQPFSLGIGYVSNNVWNSTEITSSGSTVVAGKNTSTTIGNFTFSPSVVSTFNSNGGPSFINRSLGDGGNFVSGNGAGFAFSVNGSWSGPTPANAAVVPNYQIAINITSLGLYVLPFTVSTNTGASGYPFGFAETTPSHNTATSPTITTGIARSSVGALKTDYTHLVWTPPTYDVAGTSFSRSFGLASPHVGDLQIDGAEIDGFVTITYDQIPEPAASMLILSGGAALILRRSKPCA